MRFMRIDPSCHLAPVLDGSQNGIYGQYPTGYTGNYGKLWETLNTHTGNYGNLLETTGNLKTHTGNYRKLRETLSAYRGYVP